MRRDCEVEKNTIRQAAIAAAFGAAESVRSLPGRDAKRSAASACLGSLRVFLTSDASAKGQTT